MIWMRCPAILTQFISCIYSCLFLIGFAEETVEFPTKGQRGRNERIGDGTDPTCPGELAEMSFGPLISRVEAENQTSR